MSLEEIARIAGVSKSTVSRVINKEARVSDITRSKVQAVIDATGYQPNRAARALANSRTQTIGVVVSNNIGIFFDSSFYFPTIIRGISESMTQRDYAMLLLLGKDNEDDVRFAKRIVRTQSLDGIILVSPAIGHPLIDEMLATDTKFVSADRIARDDNAPVNFITVENVASSCTAVNHLIKLGRKRIVMIAGSPEIIDTLDRIKGYKLALQDAGIPYDEQLLIGDRFSYDAGYEAIQYLLDNDIEFDGVYASQGNLAVGAVNALLDAGVRVPEDVSLIAFDDLVDGMSSRIGISTMHQPVHEKGRQLSNTLIDIVEGNIAPPIQRFLPAKLVIRDTCGG